jgi:uncharacterized membrane protein
VLSLLRRNAAVLACSAACAWAVLLVAAPWLARSAGPIGLRVSTAAYLAGSVLCHQQAGRSFHLAGAQLPVCARCSGLYVSGALGLLAGIVLGSRRDPLSRLARVVEWRWVLIGAVVPTLATLAAEWSGAWAVPGAWRAVAALPAGWTVGAFLAESLSFRGRL